MENRNGLVVNPRLGATMKRLSFVLFVALLSTASAHGQSACGQLGVNCGHPSTSTGSSRGGARSNAPQAPSPAQIAAGQAYALNEQGLAAYNKGDWTTAEAFFKKSLETEPNDQVVLGNLANTQAHEGVDAYKNGNYTTARVYFQQALANDPAGGPDNHFRRSDLAAAEEQIAVAQRDKIAAANMQQAIQSFAQSLSAVPSSGGLEFNGKEPSNNADQSSGLTFITSDSAVADRRTQAREGTRTGSFGTTISNPELEFFAGAPPVAVHSTTDHLVSAANSGAAANAKGISEEAAKANSNCAFDKAACAKFVPISVQKVIAQSPGTVALAAHIPEAAKNDTEIQQSMAYYQKLDGRKIDSQTKLAAVQKQIDGRAGNAEVLKAQKATLNEDLRRYKEDQENTQAQIKKRLKTIRVTWIEDPAPAASAKASQ